METKHIKTFEDVETEKSTLKEIPTEYEYPTKLGSPVKRVKY